MSGPARPHARASLGEVGLIGARRRGCPRGRACCSGRATTPHCRRVRTAASWRPPTRSSRAGTSGATGPPRRRRARGRGAEPAPTSPRWAAVPDRAAGRPGAAPATCRPRGCRVGRGPRRGVRAAGARWSVATCPRRRTGSSCRSPRWGSWHGRAPVLRSGARVGRRRGAGRRLGLVGGRARCPAARGCRSRAVPGRATTAGRRPTYAAGPAAAAAGATAMLDVSDGLVARRRALARASGVAIDLAAALMEPDVAALAAAVGEEDARRCVLSGGEEHALLACFPAGAALPPRWRPVGTVVRGAGVLIDGAPQGPGGGGTTSAAEPLMEASSGPSHGGSRPVPRVEVGFGMPVSRERSARDLAGLEARGADVEPLRRRPRPTSADPLDVGVPATLGAAVRVRDVVTEARPLAADVAVGSHGYLLKSMVNRSWARGRRSPATRVTGQA